jgi:hypothetical protein
MKPIDLGHKPGDDGSGVAYVPSISPIIFARRTYNKYSQRYLARCSTLCERYGSKS